MGTKPDHAVWSIVRIGMVCGTLLGLQMMTATRYDVAFNGEAGTLGGVALISILSEYLRKK